MVKSKKKLFSSIAIGAMCLTSLVGANISPKNVSASTTIASTTATGITNVFKDAIGNKYLKAYVGINEKTSGYVNDEDPIFSSYRYSNSNKVDWTVGNAYFKYEDIVWNVLSMDSNGIALVVSNQILANMPFQPTYTADTSSSDESTKYTTTANGAPSGTLANDYTYSNIRYWLNGYTQTGQTGIFLSETYGIKSTTLCYGTSFYDVAFSSSEKSKILATTYTTNSDKTDTTTYSAKAFNQSSPTTSGDKVFLLSYGDWNEYYSKNTTTDDNDGTLYPDSVKHVTDLALSQVCAKEIYWLRSGENYCGLGVYAVHDANGAYISDASSCIDFFIIGIAPAMYLNTAGIQAYTSEACDQSQASVTAGSYVKFGSYPQTIADAVEGTLDDGGGSTEAGVEITLVGLAVSGAVLLGLLAWVINIGKQKQF